MRSTIGVDVLKCAGENFKGTITPIEAKNTIYRDTLNLDRNNLHGLKVEYKGNPVISYLLKEKINIDTTFKSDDFFFEKDTTNRRSLFEGKIRGVRKEDPTPQQNDVRWVKLETVLGHLRKKKFLNGFLSMVKCYHPWKKRSKSLTQMMMMTAKIQLEMETWQCE